jgi:GTP-binding protein Era
MIIWRKKRVSYAMKRKLKIILMGEPNSGKSTLINCFVPVCIVSHRPNSTREPTLAILTRNQDQIIFVDTPGINSSKDKTSIQLKNLALRASKSANVGVFMFDATKNHLPLHLLEIASYFNRPKIAVFNKIDTVNKHKLLPLITELAKYFKEILYISSKNKTNINDILEAMEPYFIPDEWDYSSEVTTTRSTISLVEDKVKEVLFKFLYEEIAYTIELKTEIIDKEVVVYIVCNKSQKPIILSLIHLFSKPMRLNIQKILKTKIFLTLKIKVRK